MASPPQQFYMDFDRTGNSSQVACDYQGNIFISKIGEWILQDHKRKKFTYTYYHMLKNFTEESTGEEPGSIISGLLPHLLLMLVLMITLSHSLHFFLSRLKQPLIISQIIAGSLIFLPWTNGGHGHDSNDDLFLLPNKRRVEMAIALTALIFRMFVYAVKMDVTTIWRNGKKPIIIGIASLVSPLVITLIVSYIFYNNIRSFVKHKERFAFFIAALHCHTAFPVVADTLAELGLLSSELGRLAVSSALFQSITGLAFIGLFGVLDQGQHGGIISSLITAFVLSALVAFIFFVVRPYGLWVIQDTPSNGYVREVHIFVITLIMILVTLVSDLAGVVFILGPILMGFALPNGPPLGTALIERIELVGSELLLPLYYIMVGHNMDWAAAIQQSRLWLSLDLIILTLCISKFVTVLVVAYYSDMSLKNGLILGLIMNFKGTFEMFVFIDLFYGQVLDRATFTMMTSAVIIVMAICAPLVSVFYKPLTLENDVSVRQTVQNVRTHTELRVISCFFDENPIPALLDFLECLTSPDTQTYTCIYSLHLIDLNARAVSSLISHRNKKGQINMKQIEPVHKHFISFGQEKKENVTVLPFTSIAPQQNMHQDICALILERNIALVIVPFPRKNSMACLDTQDSTWSLVPKVLEQAPSSVGIVVYHGITRITPTSHSYWQYRIGVIFLGGPDDREAVAIASRMTGHPNVHINLLRFCTSNTIKSQTKKLEDSHDIEEALDRGVIDDLQKENIDNHCLVVSEVMIGDVEQIALAIRSFGDKYDLMIVGRRRGQSSLMISLTLEEWMESPELGVVGDLLASSKYENPANILVVQQHNSS